MRWPAALALLLAVAVTGPACAAPADDGRVALVEQQLEGDVEVALAMIDDIVEVDPARAREWGLDYARGHLLSELGRRDEAMAAFGETLTSTPELAPWGRYRLAVAQSEAGNAEVAAGLVATLLGEGPPRVLVAPAVELLERSIVAGGDCRLLRGLGWTGLKEAQRRRLDFARAHCSRRAGDETRWRAALLELLEEDAADDVALRAAEDLTATETPATVDARAALAIGLGLYEHREFAPAAAYLSKAVTSAPAGRDLFEVRYALARSYFWLRRWRAAARSFGALAGSLRRSPNAVGQRAKVLYQRARTLELDDEQRWPEASAAFQAAYSAHPTGGYAAASLLSRLRLAWLRGDRAAALGALDALRRARRLDQLSSGLLFLASTELSAGRHAGVAAWLEEARRLDRSPAIEIDYWRGRAAEAEGRTVAAVDHYLAAVRADRFHPFGAAARGRLRSRPLAAMAARQVKAAAARGTAGLVDAWLVLGDGDPVGHAAGLELRDRLLREPRAASYLQVAEVPVEDWPLWRGRLRTPEDKLLGLGLFGDASRRVIRHFPVADPSLAFTGGRALARAGAARRSLYIAEVLEKRRPWAVPIEATPPAYRRLLYPLHHRRSIVEESRRRGVDPFLLAAIIREESRYDPAAFSGASARGLTQFIMPTARQVAERIELAPIEPSDLHRPEIAIALGAGYLQALSEEFDGHLPSMVAAYNAGEPQAALWRQYCVSDDLVEYLTKITFRETRAYVRKVLTSRAFYADLYRSRGDEAPATAQSAGR